MAGNCSGADVQALLENFLAQPGYATPKVDVRGAVIREGRILLVHEKADGLWCMPGGWADIDEAPSAMVAREVLEESGIVAAPRKVIGVFDANRSGIPRAFFHAYKVVFLCDYVSGEPRASDETLAAGYFPFVDLPPLSENRTHPRHLEEVQKHLLDPSRASWFD
jgi:ADP-ribose pyrophosphatase YjhB (NUDIX family)